MIRCTYLTLFLVYLTSCNSPNDAEQLDAGRPAASKLISNDSIARDQEKSNRLDSLHDILKVKLLQKEFVKTGWKQYIMYSFEIENKSQRDIHAFKGKLILFDLFDDKIDSLDLTYEGFIGSNETVSWKCKFDYSFYLDQNEKLKRKPLSRIRTKWVPLKILDDNNSNR